MNTSVVGTMIASYVCPSDIYPSAIQTASYATGTGPYFDAKREGEQLSRQLRVLQRRTIALGPTGSGLPIPAFQGMFFNDISIDIAQIRDGTSNTFLAGESLQGPGHVVHLFRPILGLGDVSPRHMV